MAVEKGGQGQKFQSKSRVKYFFRVKLENIKDLHMNNMCNFSLFIEQDVSDKKQIAFAEFVVLEVN